MTITIFFVLFFSVTNLSAQNTLSMHERIEQTMQAAQQPTPESLLTCVTELKTISEANPDSIAPKKYLAQQSITYALIAPKAPQTETLLSESDQIIKALESNQEMDKSDLNTLQGMYYMALIVQNPAQNGQRYFMQVMQHYKKALKLNPDNALAKHMQDEFYKGMKR